MHCAVKSAVRPPGFVHILDEVMTVHKLAADGYTYLTKHIATGDATESANSAIVDYYHAKGTPPGRWHGRLAARAGVAVGEEVTEEQMIATFAGAWKPNRVAIRAQMRAAGASEAEISRKTALGRPFPSFNNSQELVEEVLRRGAAHKSTYGEYPPAEVALEHKREVARTILARTSPSSLLTEDDIDRYIAESYAKARQPVAGYDLVLTPPKSFSVMWGLGTAEQRRILEQIQDRAVDLTMDYIQDKVIYTRRGAGGARQVKADGLLIARFNHWDNRAGDLNLHTHCALVNRVFAEGTWTTIDGRILYQATVSGSEFYNTVVMDLAAQAMGMTPVPRPDTPPGKQPVYEFEGVPLELIEEFSRRSAIEARQAVLAEQYRAQHGKNPPKRVQYAQAQQATLDTRNNKNPPRSLEELCAEWRTRADAVMAVAAQPGEQDNDPGAHPLAQVPTTGDRRPRFQPEMIGEIAQRIEDELSRVRGTWTGFTIHAEAQRLLREYRFGSIEERITQTQLIVDTVRDVLCRPVYVELYEAPDRIAERESAMHARLQSKDKSTLKYTSEQVISAVQYMRDAVNSLSPLTVSSTVIRRQVEAAEERIRRDVPDFAMGDDQQEMINHFLRARRLVAVAIGAAGSGKTTAAAVVARSWESTGARVLALGPSAQAAEVLGEKLGVEGRTIADVLTRDRVGIPTGIRAGDMLLVDEAGMASARDLADLTRIAAQHGAVVRLLGDPEQLAAVESSGVLRDLAERTDAPFLRQIHRFSDPDEARISLALRSGDTTVLDWYASHNRIRPGMKHQLPDLVFADYAADTAAGLVTVMVAPTNEMVRALNERAALHYRGTGVVAGPEVELSDGLRAAVGDIVVTRKNTSKYPVNLGVGRKNARVKNGDLWKVTEVHADGSMRLQSKTSGGSVWVPADYIGQHVELGYASTVHRAQGLTVQVCRVLADPYAMDRQSLYVSLTRGTESNIVYAATDELPDYEFEHRPTPHPRHIALLRGIIDRDGSERTALSQMEEAAAVERSLAEQIRTYTQSVMVLYEDYTRERLATRLAGKQLEAVVTSPGWADVVRTVTDAEIRGMPSREMFDTAVVTLRRTGARGGFDDEDNTPAKVLARALREARPQRRPPRTDDLALLGVPLVTSAAANTDPELAAFLRALARKMLITVHSAAHRAEQERAEWVAALGSSGTDVRRNALRSEVITRIMAYRLARGLDQADPDPLTGLPEDGPVAKLIPAVTAPGSHQQTYSALTPAALGKARRAARARLAKVKRLLDGVEQEISGLEEGPAAIQARRYLQQTRDQAATIAAARNALEHVDALRQGSASAAQLAAATAAVQATLSAAPDRDRWDAIEFAAMHPDEALQRINRATASDREQTEDAMHAAERLRELVRQEAAVLAAIDLEHDNRGGRTGTAGPAAGPDPYTPSSGNAAGPGL